MLIQGYIIPHRISTNCPLRIRDTNLAGIGAVAREILRLGCDVGTDGRVTGGHRGVALEYTTEGREVDVEGAARDDDGTPVPRA